MHQSRWMDMTIHLWHPISITMTHYHDSYNDHKKKCRILKSNTIQILVMNKYYSVLKKRKKEISFQYLWRLLLFLYNTAEEVFFQYCCQENNSLHKHYLQIVSLPKIKQNTCKKVQCWNEPLKERDDHVFFCTSILNNTTVVTDHFKINLENQLKQVNSINLYIKWLLI